MKKLHVLILKSFIGPLLMTFAICLALLLMQFLWRYVDDLVGKGLSAHTVIELMLWASCSLVPMALPLAILLAALMTFGNLGENYELLALKSAGISLIRIMKPLIIVSSLLVVVAFLFANYALPFANLKMRSLLYDIQQSRPELQIREGVFYNGIENYSIKIGDKDPKTNKLSEVYIYDHSAGRGNTSVTFADSGYIKVTDDKRYLMMTLLNGYSYSDVQKQRNSVKETYPFRRDRFDKEVITIELVGFGLQRTDESLFKSNMQMLNLNQLSYAADSLTKQLKTEKEDFKLQTLRSDVFRPYKRFKQPNDTIKKKATINIVANKIPVPLPSAIKVKQNENINITQAFHKWISKDTISRLAYLSVKEQMLKDTIEKNYTLNIDSFVAAQSTAEKASILGRALEEARLASGMVESQKILQYNRQKRLNKHNIEWHRKFTLSLACIIFFFVGAPFGAIVRKGGLGMPVVISVIFFVLYYVISMSGEKFVKESVLPAWQGMWISTMILLPLGIYLTYKATNDSPIMSFEVYIDKLKKLFFPARHKKKLAQEKVQNKIDRDAF